ncbi:MAG: hypothetical protein PHI68_01200 [Candidatus Cloacimonetes bacterium]|nr:hypothetical protein [Candidatus Cloacimonadota bacterium]
MESRITFKYKFSPDYNPLYINGAYGGVNESGDIVVNFYLERHCLPNTEEYAIKENQLMKLSNEPTDLNSSWLRFVQNGIVMNLHTAKNIVQWLQQKIADVENLQSVTEITNEKKTAE